MGGRAREPANGMWTVMSRWGCVFAVGTLVACGGKEQVGASASVAADASAEAACVDCSPWAEVLPDGGRQLVDGFVPPTTPTLECDGSTSVSLLLPCELGQAPYHELECKLNSGEGFGLVAFPDSATSPSQPLDLTKFGPSGTGGFTSRVLQGTVNVIEFHESERSFLGELKDVVLLVEDSSNGSSNQKTCRLKDGILWAVPGPYL
jgi:hypothetical protein